MTKIINHGKLREHGENNALAKYKGKSFVKGWGLQGGRGETFSIPHFAGSPALQTLTNSSRTRAGVRVKIRDIAKKVEVLKMGILCKRRKHNDIQKTRKRENFHRWLKSGEKVEEKWKHRLASVDAFIMAGSMCKDQKTWFPPSGRHSTGLCYVGVGIVDASIMAWLAVYWFLDV